MSGRGTSQWLDRPDARLHWRRDGVQEGQPLLLIHEMGGALSSWDAVVATLGDDWDCLRSDMRGCGQSSPISGTAPLDELVTDQIALWDAAGLKSPATIAAAAIGAAVAVTLAARYPERVERLVLLAPAFGVPADRSAGLLAAADRIEADGAEPFVRGTLDGAYPARLRKPDVFQAFLETQLGNDAASFAAYWRMLARLDLRDELIELKAPVTILAGSADAIRPPDQIERLPGATFHIIDSGHFMALQTPELVASAIAEVEPAIKDS